MISDFGFSVRLIVFLFEHGYFWQLILAVQLVIVTWRLPDIIRAWKGDR